MSESGKVTLDSGEGTVITVPGSKITIKLRGEETGSSFSLAEFELYGQGPPRHYHSNIDETVYVIDGEMNILLGEEIFKVKAGSFVFIPRGIVHTVGLIDSKPCKFLSTFSPPGFEKFFEEAKNLDASDVQSFYSKGEALAKKYELTVAGPPL